MSPDPSIQPEPANTPIGELVNFCDYVVGDRLDKIGFDRFLPDDERREAAGLVLDEYQRLSKKVVVAYGNAVDGRAIVGAVQNVRVKLIEFAGITAEPYTPGEANTEESKNCRWVAARFAFFAAVTELHTRFHLPPPSDAGKPKGKRKHKPDAGNRLKMEAKQDLIKNYIDKNCGGKWDGTLPELETELAENAGLKVSVPTLCRYGYGDPKNQRLGNPPETFSRKGEREPVTNDKSADGGELDAWTMPDDE